MTKMNESLLFFLLSEITKRNRSREINKKKLSKVIIQLDQEGFNITPVIAGIKDLTTPYLKYIIEDLRIFNIMTKSSPLEITNEGIKYINSKIQNIYKDPEYRTFIDTTGRIIEETYL